MFDNQLTRDCANMQYTCGTNILWMNQMLSVTPFVPISLARVKQQSEMVTPGLQKVN